MTTNRPTTDTPVATDSDALTGPIDVAAIQADEPYLRAIPEDDGAVPERRLRRWPALAMVGMVASLGLIVGTSYAMDSAPGSSDALAAVYEPGSDEPMLSEDPNAKPPEHKPDPEPDWSWPSNPGGWEPPTVPDEDLPSEPGDGETPPDPELPETDLPETDLPETDLPELELPQTTPPDSGKSHSERLLDSATPWEA